MIDMQRAVNPRGLKFSCGGCQWSGLTPDVTNGILMLEDGRKQQTWHAVCPTCGCAVTPAAAMSRTVRAA